MQDKSWTCDNICYPLEDHPASSTYYQNDHKANKLAELVQLIKETKAASNVTIARSYHNANVNMWQLVA